MVDEKIQRQLEAACTDFVKNFLDSWRNHDENDTKVGNRQFKRHILGVCIYIDSSVCPSVDFLLAHYVKYTFYSSFPQYFNSSLFQGFLVVIHLVGNVGSEADLLLE